MQYLFYLIKEFLCAAVILVPVLVLIWGIWLREWKRAAWYCVFGLYLSAVYFLVGLPTLPGVGYLRFWPNLNLIPFQGIAEDLRNTVLNVALFVPMGFLLPLLWERYRKGMRAIYFGLCVSLTIEIVQLFLGRATDVNDLIANTAGTALGFLAAFPLRNLIHPSRRNGEEFQIIAVTCMVMFFVQPYLVLAFY